eukprot:TRINITY_DN8716_c0_g1_i1.p1 TRINITY_DN8716_c0_g1~~TRINITY_DN8716_c0_g1_i1.p1  ORF type:complete len:109 (-),score=20.14 TRINITY_DN8716_c0_g1_i1:228-554(-)
MLHLALDAHATMESLSIELGRQIQLRIGVGMGGAVSAVIGSTKFSYDVWGDGISDAHRMESSGTATRTQVTESVYTATSDLFSYEIVRDLDGFYHYFLQGRLSNSPQS